MGSRHRPARPRSTAQPSPLARRAAGRRIERIAAADARYQRLEVIKRNRTKRHRYGQFLVEGVQAIDRALLHGWPLDALVYPAGRVLSAWAAAVLAGADAATRLVELAPPLMDALSDRDEPSELLAVARIPADDLGRIVPGANLLLVVFDRPNSPGNLGTLLRSCDAFGAHGLIVTGHGADPYHPLAVRGSMGSLFALPTVRQPSHREVLAWLDALGAPARRPTIVGGTAEAATAVEHADLTGPTVLVLGNETRGLSRAYREACDTLVRVPMVGAADSLNVACAGSVLLYEAARQRRAAAGRRAPAAGGG